MTAFALPVLFALFAWWFSTGLVLYLDGLPRRTFKWTMAGASVVLAVALCGLGITRDDASSGGAYMAFAFGLAAWAWLEVSFYLGYVTGPRQHACAPGCRGWRHFGHALAASLYHEIACAAIAALVVAVTWGGANQTGAWTFVVLWLMHESARLNVFLGVRNAHEEFLPDHLRYLRSFFADKPINPLFPLSVTAGTGAAVIFALEAIAAGAGSFAGTGLALLAALTALAVLEHWFLVIPLPDAALWRWALRSREAPAAANHIHKIEPVIPVSPRV